MGSRIEATFGGHRAVQLGLGSRVLDAADVLPAALELAHDIAENTAPMSVAASKRLLWDSFDLDREAVADRVALLWPVERDGGHTAVDYQQQCPVIGLGTVRL